jgi:tetratricopeptide (TPR) repeat protein
VAGNSQAAINAPALERVVDAASKAATEAARLAAITTDAAKRTDERQISELALAAQDAARLAADASRDAARAAERANAAARSLEGRAVAQREAARARSAAERAWEAVDEARDRPTRTASASAVRLASAPRMFQALRRSMRAESSFTYGRDLLEAQKYGEARDLFAEAVVLYPEHDEARALLAWTDYFLGDFRGAVVEFKTALQRQPTWEGLHNGLGWSRLRLGRYHLAIAAFRPALERNPEYFDALHGLGSALLELGDYENALPPLEKALHGSRPLVGEEPPETAAIRAKVAWSLYYLQRYREALQMFIRASLGTPDSYQLHAGMGWCYLKLGQRDDARTAFKRALQLRPDDEGVRDGLRRAGI